jgi:hypothetical protein
MTEFKEKKEKNEFYLYHLQEEHVKASFKSGKELILIGIAQKDPQVLDDFIAGTHTIAHEKHAHAINVFMDKEMNNIEDHATYNEWRSNYSPTKNDIKWNLRYFGTPANKDMKEIIDLSTKDKEVSRIVNKIINGNYEKTPDSNSSKK